MLVFLSKIKSAMTDKTTAFAQLKALQESHMNNDKEVIKSLGGPGALASKLGYSFQRVKNWEYRGIPAKQKLDHPELLMPELAEKSKQAA